MSDVQSCTEKHVPSVFLGASHSSAKGLAQIANAAREKSYRTPGERNLELAQVYIRAAAIPMRGENGKAALARAVELLGLTLRRGYRLFYREDGARVTDAEIAKLRSQTHNLLRLRLARIEQEADEIREAIRVAECTKLATANVVASSETLPAPCSRCSPHASLCSPARGRERVGGFSKPQNA